MAETGTDTLIPVSMELLYGGMLITHDIFNSDGSILLLKRGNRLEEPQIKAMRRLNGDRDTIYVTAETKRQLVRKSLSCEIPDPAALEKTTGYAEAKDETQSLLMEIGDAGSVPKDKLRDVSEELSGKLEVTRPDLLMSMINALAPEDEYLQRHCINVGLLNGLIGKWLELPKKEVDRLIMIGLLHDCGKKLLPQAVLNAPRALNTVEFEVVKMHTVHSYDLLSGFPEDVRQAARGHHEKRNGRGYPDSLSGDSIPSAARITAVSDIYDAMVSRRVYKGPNSPFRILKQLEDMRGEELEPAYADVFLQNMPNELAGKPVVLSDGNIGTVDAVDPGDLEYPFVKVRGKVVKSGENLFCVCMYYEGYA